MRLEEYWGVGPKTRELLERELGVERAVEAIETADTRALVGAGLSPGRATRILRRAQGGESMDLLATRDTREVYKELLDLAGEYALTEDAASRVRILTPLATREAMEDHVDRVLEARDAWTALDDETQSAVRDAFETHDAGGDLPHSGEVVVPHPQSKHDGDDRQPDCQDRTVNWKCRVGNHVETTGAGIAKPAAGREPREERTDDCDQRADADQSRPDIECAVLLLYVR